MAQLVKISKDEKGLCIYRSLTDVVIGADETGKVQVFAMVEDRAMGSDEENDIINRIQPAFNVKIEK